MERESFQSRLGFILISAGCAIGIGNVWKFPYTTGASGGGAFVLFYLLFLGAVGVPIMTMEFAVGRAARKSAAEAFAALEKPGQKWHWYGPVSLAGNYILMLFYTTVAGWMLCYFTHFAAGEFAGASAESAAASFAALLASPGTMTFWMLVVVALGFGACSLGLQKGVERVSKMMMLSLLVLIVALACYCLTLPGAAEGIRFYLLPDWEQVQSQGLFTVIAAAMNQAFFTLSIGIGGMTIFGSYLDRSRSLAGESIRIAVLDTFVAVTAGLIIFPACFTYDIRPDSGPSLVFITLSSVFGRMPGGRVLGSLFFLLLSFAALSTVLAVFENILAGCMDTFGWTRRRAVLVNFFVVALGSLPCVLGFNLWAGFAPLGAGSTVMDLEDFLVSNLLLPGGSLVFVLFCTTRWGWGFDKYLAETNTGRGAKLPRALRLWVSIGIPLVVAFVLGQGISARLFAQ